MVMQIKLLVLLLLLMHLRNALPTEWCVMKTKDSSKGDFNWTATILYSSPRSLGKKPPLLRFFLRGGGGCKQATK